MLAELFSDLGQPLRNCRSIFLSEGARIVAKPRNKTFRTLPIAPPHRPPAMPEIGQQNANKHQLKRQGHSQFLPGGMLSGQVELCNFATSVGIF